MKSHAWKMCTCFYKVVDNANITFLFKCKWFICLYHINECEDIFSSYCEKITDNTDLNQSTSYVTTLWLDYVSLKGTRVI